MSSDVPSFDVVVAGGGPVGMLLAAELALQGVRPLVLERLPTPTGESKAGTLHARTAQSLNRRGLLDAVGQSSYGGVRFHFSGMFELDLGPAAGEGPSIVGSPQAWAEQVFADRATGLGAEIRRGHEVTGLTQDADHVTLTVEGPAGPYELTARYVVGADGARSAVRKLAGIPFTGTPAGVAALMGDVRLLDPLPGGWHRTPRGWLLVWGGGTHGHSRISTYDFRGPHADREAPVSLEELRSVVEHIAGHPVRMAGPRGLTRYGDAALQAETYRRGRVLVAGDAAHVHFPWGGQGLNTGMEDAMNLGWKLAAQVRGWAPDGLLDTYHGERHPVAARVLWNVRAQTALADPDPGVDPLRELFAELMRLDQVNDHLSAMISGTATAYDVGHPGAGRLAPDTELKTADGAITLVELLRAGRPLFLCPPDGGADGAGPDGGERPADVAAEWAGRVDTVRAAQCEPRLIRPDGYVAWCLPGDAATLRAALRRWFGEPG
ncbi:FAD-dependent monooxygenase [Streptosporangium roseum]|uniref:Monooxygenase n=1 Tax=Streptosporangium roseum (strain ATCC 12428 / DSM 43021 / JCM 3005 / KCTC 9067 / NCIMB 10171 / NRRL 2505 / NI 9100) TaxID=479432 RepID=D2B5V9_STRRD|nr:FAD-dependent monooxygenase [Streptosporangium roseum]ACZ91413.1 putative monooxygenase [Streptosporangium roseum DSM 43021]